MFSSGCDAFLFLVLVILVFVFLLPVTATLSVVIVIVVCLSCIIACLFFVADLIVLLECFLRRAHQAPY